MYFYVYGRTGYGRTPAGRRAYSWAGRGAGAAEHLWTVAL